MPDYSRLDRALHALALGTRAVKNMSFDLERWVTRPNGAFAQERPHVFITGLARAGTSVLLRTLYRSGCFACQTYRDMPFVLAPGLWGKLSRKWRRAGVAGERAHADGLLVDFDSVEAFEEVFWLTFAGELYVRQDYLKAHEIDDDLAALFCEYVSVVTTAQDQDRATRYLSKNNNNLLRLTGLARTFRRALFIVPFRSPVQQAHSLLRQHRQLASAQMADPFIRKYMRWLGHFEFGSDYRPFCFQGEFQPRPKSDSDQLQHWVERWTETYQAVLADPPDNVVLWDYDAFCADPKRMAAALAEHLDLDADPLRQAAADIRKPRDYPEDQYLPDGILKDAFETHAALRRKSFGATGE